MFMMLAALSLLVSSSAAQLDSAIEIVGDEYFVCSRAKAKTWVMLPDEAGNLADAAMSSCSSTLEPAMVETRRFYSSDPQRAAEEVISLRATITQTMRPYLIGQILEWRRILAERRRAAE